MSFMRPEIVYGNWHLYDGDWTIGVSADSRRGWGARLSAPGYMDCTDWQVFETEDEAREYLVETHDLCPTCLGDEEGCRCPLTVMARSLGDG